MSTSLRQLLLELVSPLSLAAYAAWLAVWLSVTGAPPRNPALGMWVQAGALAFLAVFVFTSACSDRLSLRMFTAFGLGLAGLALLLCALAPQSAAPILLVLAAPMLAARLNGGSLWLALAAINLGLAAIMLGLWPGQPRWLLVSWTAYTSFQVFAALVMQASRRAEAMSEQLRAVNADLIATRSLLEASARDAERLRLSRELHDVAGHALTALKLNLGVMARDTRQPDAERVALCAGLADDLLQNLRGVVKQMRAHEGIDLASAIEQLAAPFPKPSVHLDIAGDARVFAIERAEALLRTVQEGLTNSARHAAASHLWLRLYREGEQLRLEIRDDGRGARPLRSGNGLRGMRERLRELGGELTIDHGDEGGLRLLASLPIGTA
ncbi:MAG: sensor histidine kinase [Pseudomarimonas sp.]